MVNRGKQFENVIKESFEKVEGVSIDRIHDQTNGYAGSANISDFIMYKYPHEYYIECKSVHGNTLPFSNITNNQWNGMLEKSKIPGVFAGVICWWIDKDVTLFIPIQLLQVEKNLDHKSIRYDYGFAHYDKETGKISPPVTLSGKKKRVFWDYDMTTFFKEVGYEV